MVIRRCRLTGLCPPRSRDSIRDVAAARITRGALGGNLLAVPTERESATRGTETLHEDFVGTLLFSAPSLTQKRCSKRQWVSVPIDAVQQHLLNNRLASTGETVHLDLKSRYRTSSCLEPCDRGARPAGMTGYRGQVPHAIAPASKRVLIDDRRKESNSRTYAARLSQMVPGLPDETVQPLLPGTRSRGRSGRQCKIFPTANRALYWPVGRRCGLKFLFTSVDPVSQAGRKGKVNDQARLNCRS